MHLTFSLRNDFINNEVSNKDIIFCNNTIRIYQSDDIFSNAHFISNNLVCCVYGEIYNGKDVLTKHNYAWQDNFPRSITQPILLKDFSLLSELNGTFIIVVYDIENNNLYVISDRYGSHRFYYGNRDGNIDFSSSIWNLKHHGYELQITEDYLIQFLSFGYIVTDNTFLNNVKVNSYATIYEVNKNGLAIQQYWNLEFNEDDPIRDVDQVVEMASDIWPKAVERRIRNCSHISIPLSGGLDSRAVLAAALECKTAGDITTFTGGTPGTLDFEIGRLVAKTFGVKNIPMDMTQPKDYLAEYRQASFNLHGLVESIQFFFATDWQLLFKNSNNVITGFLAGVFTGAHLSSKSDLNNSVFDEIIKLNKISSLEIVAQTLEKSNNDSQHKLFSIVRSADKKNNNQWQPNTSAHWDFDVRQRNYILTLISPRSNANLQLPCIDNNWVDLCLTIAPSLRFDSKWYRRFLAKKYPEFYKLPTKNLNGQPLVLSVPQESEAFIMKVIKRGVSSLPLRQSKALARKVPRSYFCNFNKRINPDPRYCRKTQKSINYLDYGYWMRGDNQQWKDAIFHGVNNVIQNNIISERRINEIVKNIMAGDDRLISCLFSISTVGYVIDLYKNS